MSYGSVVAYRVRIFGDVNNVFDSYDIILEYVSIYLVFICIRFGLFQLILLLFIVNKRENQSGWLHLN